MIRQAISCDICGAEKQLTNHWFVACDHGGELRISEWDSRNRLRAGAKHLCGQTCLHKLVDDFMARTLSARVPAAAAAKAGTGEPTRRTTAARTDASLTSNAAYAASTRSRVDASDCNADPMLDEFESSARLITPPEPVRSSRATRPGPAVLAAVPPTSDAGEDEAALDEPAGYSSLNLRAEAWKREREREQRAASRRPAAKTQRRFIA